MDEVFISDAARGVIALEQDLTRLDGEMREALNEVLNARRELEAAQLKLRGLANTRAAVLVSIRAAANIQFQDHYIHPGDIHV